jgi:hypothetical protein
MAFNMIVEEVPEREERDLGQVVPRHGTRQDIFGDDNTGAKVLPMAALGRMQATTSFLADPLQTGRN